MSVEKSLFSKYVTIFFVVSGYWIVSITTVFVNKTLFSHIDLDAPMFVNFTQTLITAAICYMKKILSTTYPNTFRFPDVDLWDKHTLKTVLPLSILFTTMISTNNLCLKYTSVAYYYIGRSLTTIFNVVFTFLILGETTSRKCIACCAVIIGGFWLGVDQENLAGSLSIPGFIFGILGSLSLSLFSIFTKKVLPKLNGEIWALSYANNVYASILLFFVMILNNELGELYNYPKFSELFFWSIVIVGGVCGFTIGYFTTLQIKYTSALTHNISGTAKACAQTVLATYWYHETKSLLWWTSNFIVLSGSACYTWIKQLDMERRHKENIAYQRV
ncbi:GDP-fucose transporter 1 [Diorhabda carinulata]|uniref:GDP-fucose transporter 1 n=1 Tax=Diorhabda carinulata TaxID=1163345 RepID=UPI0025A04A4F|nr:GDP-fucose transporter 1 [Diorhabda carinulata]